jgi:hypothetical protein
VPRLIVKQLHFEDVFQDMARLALEHRPHAKAGKVIVLKVGGRTARALARGAPGRDATSIYLDDATRDRLEVSAGQQVDLEIERGRFWDEFLWGWHATNAVTRVAARLGIVSVGLGLLGLVLGAWALWLTLAAG